MAAPPRPPAVVLVGFMGAGKSAVGRELAARLRLPFLDSDELIAAAEGPIDEIFATRGEPAFRALETRTVLGEIEALEDAPKVLALGGGAVLADEVREALRPLAHVVLLTAPVAELWRRVTGDGDAARPLARDRGAFEALLAAREPLYREVATLTVETARRDPGEVASRIVRLLGEEAAAEGQGASPLRREGSA